MRLKKHFFFRQSTNTIRISIVCIDLIISQIIYQSSQIRCQVDQDPATREITAGIMMDLGAPELEKRSELDSFSAFGSQRGWVVSPYNCLTSRIRYV